MNKLAIFDLDGVLADLRDLHFEALNSALSMCGHPKISRADHLTRFDGLPTSTKLRMLGITGDEASTVSELKQEFTLSSLSQYVKPDPALAKLLHKTYSLGYLLAVVSNARQETVKQCLKLLSVEYLFAWVVTPDLEGSSPKPSPEMYTKLMVKANACPLTTIIFEDAPAGLKAAHLSGARAIQVNGQITEATVMAALSEERPVYLYQWPELNVLIPAAGRGQRFRSAGFDWEKPFIEVEGRRMVDAAISNLGISAIIRPIFLGMAVPFPSPGSVCTIKETRGTAETCLLCKNQIDGDSPLLIANCDQILEWDHLSFYYFCQNTKLDGVIVTFDCQHSDPRWSYCEMNNDGTVKRVAEKEPISTVANVGVYFWKRGSDFVKYAERMIEKDIRVNGEYYAAPVYNEAIADGKRIGVFKADKFWSLGTPELLKAYLERPR